MNIQSSVWLTVGLMAAPIAVTPQITTLSYEGDLMTGNGDGTKDRGFAGVSLKGIPT